MPSIPTLIHRILACGLLALCGTTVQADSRGVIFTPPIHTLIASLEGDFAGLPGQDDPRFGFSVALHGDTLAVGAPGTLTGSGGNIYRRGAVFLYRRQQEGHGWQFLQRIAFGVGGDGQCGHAVALSDSFLMVGCPWHQVSGVARGRAVILARDGGTGLYGDAVPLRLMLDDEVVATLAPDQPPGQVAGELLLPLSGKFNYWFLSSGSRQLAVESACESGIVQFDVRCFDQAEAGASVEAWALKA